MSKLRFIEDLKALTPENLQRKYPIKTKLGVMETDNSYVPQDLLRTYRLRIPIGVDFAVPDFAYQDNALALEHATERAVRSVIEHLYGQVRHDIIELMLDCRNELEPHKFHAIQEQFEELIDKVSY